ncbi:TPM domain-containing protein [Sphingomonas antarctica]|uniref:TPM domain-containing protein n=1 Tax=Sphingomonas antarctica TaxID=2040274 RepID=UPI0039E98775
MVGLDDAGRALVSQAVSDAEGTTSGEILTVVTEQSDPYHDAAIQYAVLVMFLALAAFASFPALYERLIGLVSGGWGDLDFRNLMIVIMIALALKYFGTRLILAWMPLRIALVPKSTKRRRVRRRALELFKVGAEARTTGRTGILIYLSMREHMAEIIADEAIHAKVPEERWGDAMVALVAEVRHGRVAEGMAAAVTQVGSILREGLPRLDGDVNELPDRLIEL